MKDTKEKLVEVNRASTEDKVAKHFQETHMADALN